MISIFLVLGFLKIGIKTRNIYAYKFFNAIFCQYNLFHKINKMDYKKKSLSKLNRNESYEEIDTRLASGWYVDSLGNSKRKKYKTKEVLFKISKKQT